MVSLLCSDCFQRRNRYAAIILVKINQRLTLEESLHKFLFGRLQSETAPLHASKYTTLDAVTTGKMLHELMVHAEWVYARWLETRLQLCIQSYYKQTRQEY